MHELTAIPWHWEWVPRPSDGDAVRAEWADHVVGLFELWTEGGWESLRAAWPEAGREAFPFTADTIGRESAGWLRERADSLPVGARLAWGAGFVAGRPRWAPVPVVVQYFAPQAEDPNYLMDVVGAAGRPDDGREPSIDYVTTPFGDGLRVLALARSTDGAAFGRLDAAMRLDWPADDHRLAMRVDVVLTTRVLDLALLAVIGPGVEQLMQLVATDGRDSDAAATAGSEEVSR